MNLQSPLSEAVHYRSSRFIINVIAFVYNPHMRFMFTCVRMNKYERKVVRKCSEREKLFGNCSVKHHHGGPPPPNEGCLYIHPLFFCGVI